MRRVPERSVNCLRRDHHLGRGSGMHSVSRGLPRGTRVPAINRAWRRLVWTHDDHWEWQGAKTNGGYGVINLGGGQGVRVVHRLVYETLVGPVPEGLDLDHLCRVRECSNPFHLEPVTRQVNVDRGLIGRRPDGLCRHGHDSGFYERAGNERECRECVRLRNVRAWQKTKESR